MMHHLPQAVVFEILSSLPVKSLMRFKCVCKTWRDLIKDRQFISSHFNNYTLSSTAASADLLVLRWNFSDPIQPVVLSLLSHPPPASASTSNTSDDKISTALVNVKDLPLPQFATDVWPFGHSNTNIVGPCNGIVCLYNNPDDIALWNPAIREHKVLPVSRIPRPPNTETDRRYVGFGFDSKTNDYKVLQVLYCIDDNYQETQFEVFSLGTNSWRKLDNVVEQLHIHDTGWTFGNKISCFLAMVVHGEYPNERKVEVILSFDMCDEEFKTISLPPDIGNWGFYIGVYEAIVPFNESSIAVVNFPVDLQQHPESNFNIWVMSEFGVEESWIKLYSIKPPRPEIIWRPLGFWKDCEFLMQSKAGELVLCDPNDHTQEIKHLGLGVPIYSTQLLIYKESLVTIN